MTVSYTCTDSGSGVDVPASDLADDFLTTSGTATGTCVDYAGNSASASRSAQIDREAPTVTVTNVSDGAQYVLGSVPAAGCSTTDSTSGVAAAATVTVTPTGSNVGSFTATCSRALDNAGNQASSVSAGYRVVYAFGGFFSPIDNPPVFNVTKAGQAIPVKFSLGGNQGLIIFAAGNPKSQQIACNSSAPLDDIEQTVSAGSSSLSCDPVTDQYTYVWKTDKSWARTCRQLIVRLTDGNEHMANFKFN